MSLHQDCVLTTIHKSTKHTLCGTNPLVPVLKGNGGCQVKNCKWIPPVGLC